MALYSSSSILPCIPLLVTICVVGSIVYSLIYNILLSPLAKFPGPWLAKVTGLWKAYHVQKGNLEQQLLRLHQQHGRIVRIGPNHLDVSDATAVKAVLGGGKSWKKSSFYNAFTALRPNLFGVRDEEIHAARRRAVANSFSAQNIAAMEVYIDEVMVDLIARLDEKEAKGEVVDLKKWISYFVLDVLGELAFSKNLGVVNGKEEAGMPPIREHVLLATVSGMVPWLIPYVNKVTPYIPVAGLQRMIKGRGQLRQMAVDSVNDVIADKTDRKDLLGKLLEELEVGTDSKGMSFDLVDVQTEAFGFIIAGSHTTAATSTLLLWHLMHNPETLEELVAEIDTIPQPNSPSYPNALTRDLTYLAAARDENFRISPVFVMPLPRVVPEGGKEIAGHFIPAGTELSLCNHVLHHDESVFGPKLETFRPERWLDEGYDKAQYLMAFGSGHRACIGRNLANVEIQKIVVSLLARYEMELVGEHATVLGRMPKTKSFGAADLDEDFLVRLKRRDRSDR